MKKIKYLLLAVFLILGIMNCGKKTENPEKEQVASGQTQGDTQKFLSDKEIEEIIKISDENPDKINSYISIINGLNEAVLGSYSGAYKKDFTDGSDGFKVPQGEAIDNFLKIYEQYEDKYKELDVILDEAEKKTRQKPELKKLDGFAKSFIENMKKERIQMEEMYKYYKSKEYEKDSFSKGKELNDAYFKAIYASGEKYIPFYSSFQEILAVVENTPKK